MLRHRTFHEANRAGFTGEGTLPYFFVYWLIPVGLLLCEPERLEEPVDAVPRPVEQLLLVREVFATVLLLETFDCERPVVLLLDSFMASKSVKWNISVVRHRAMCVRTND